MFNLNEFLRPHIKALKPYASARDEYAGTEGTFLDANENAYGSVTDQPFNRYPDPHQKILKKRIAEIKGVLPEEIFLGNGSDEAIDLIFRIFCNPGKDNVIIMPPTYGMYEVSAELNEVELKRVYLTDDYNIDVPAVLQSVNKNTKVIWICSPNNPTGNDLREEHILEILNNYSGIVVIDEAYIDFSSHKSYSSYLKQFPNLIILQTFSKAWGLAGLRLGMAFASAEIIAILDKIKAPYNVNILTQKYALEGLSNIKWKDEVVGRIEKDKQGLIDLLNKIPRVQKIYPSNANFLLVKVKNARDVYHALVKENIIVRDRSSVKLCEDCLRITVGTEEENQMLAGIIERLELEVRSQKSED